MVNGRGMGDRLRRAERSAIRSETPAGSLHGFETWYSAKSFISTHIDHEIAVSPLLATHRTRGWGGGYEFF